MALTPGESAIVDLLDAGLSEAEIVARGFTAGFVHFTVSTFGSQRSNRTADAVRERRIRNASGKLLAAIRKARAA